MKGFVGTVLSGAIGLAALYVVGKIAFQAGHDIAKAECKYEQLQRGISAKTAKPETSDEEEENSIPEETTDMAIPEKKQSKLGMLFGLRKMLSKKGRLRGWGSDSKSGKPCDRSLRKGTRDSCEREAEDGLKEVMYYDFFLIGLIFVRSAD